MSAFVRLSTRTSLLASRLPLQTSLRTVLNNSEWRPSEDVPVTAEDRAATAHKYNMLPEDYKPCPPERAAGDMPDVAPAGKFFDRDPWQDYDYPMDRQNWNEPHHPDDHIKYDKTRLGQGPENQPGLFTALTKLLMLPVSFLLISYGLRELQFMNPTFPARKLEPNVVHYSFEKVDDSGKGVRY